MIILDTNVVSEPLRSTGEPAVLAWLDRQNIETLFITTIGLAELRYGVAALPDGKRKDGLDAALETRVIALFVPRILAFDRAAAEACAVIRARAKRAGKAIGTAKATSRPPPRPMASRWRPVMPHPLRRPECPS